ncbi:MAG: hypothetical protein CM1200mP33_2210 [Chloroflexota bacterium]|nr:MAG: hypothetical protein CM1200mP33_2210 [Chloroflexota bacterium]
MRRIRSGSFLESDLISLEKLVELNNDEFTNENILKTPDFLLTHCESITLCKSNLNLFYDKTPIFINLKKISRRYKVYEQKVILLVLLYMIMRIDLLFEKRYSS